MKFRKIFRLGLSAILILSAAGAAQTERPNILFLLADDWAWPHASCLGMPGVQTPTFDRIAREGVLFRNAHAAAPSCSPSRAAILTGQWPWRLEQGANLRGFIANKFAVYPDLLENAGYFVGLTGKGYGPGSSEGRPHNAAGQNFKDFDKFLAARPQGKPFCFRLGSHFPHRPYQSGSGVKSGMDPAKVRVPPYLPDNEIITRDFHYVRNFRPNRWPAGDPVIGSQPGFDQFAKDTRTGSGDVDSGPAKAWLATHRADATIEFERAFGKRPGRELYDLRHDPFELRNVAEDPAYVTTVKELETRLMTELKAAGDPRVIGTGDEFDRYPNASENKPKSQSR